MRFGVLGPLAVWTVDGLPVRVPEVKVRALLADLLVHAGHPVSADRLADDLWGDRLPANPANSLQTKVSQLRRALAPHGRELVGYEPAGYVLRTSAVDVLRFQELLRQAAENADVRGKVALLTEALALWRGPALADFADEEFARPAIVRWQEQRLTAYEDRAQASLLLAEAGTVADELAPWVAVHPFRELLRALHLRALDAVGRRREALDSYRELRKRMVDELGIEPGPEVVAAHQAILEQAPVRVRTNLPASVSALVGRDDARDTVRRLLETSRLVTLTGPGGVGKTALALETARQLEFPDGCWWVEWAAVERDAPEAVLVDVVLAALDIRSGSLDDVLRSRLLVLDNCEHVIESAAHLIARLLAVAPDVRVLATSREPLGIAGERVWAVPPLPESSAMELFVARATAAAPEFSLNADDEPTLAAICQRLEGIALAVELAATRVRALGVAELAARLDPFLTLANGKRDVPARQRTLRAVIDWSWELLSDPERAVLRRLAVHADGCALSAAEAVCSGEGVENGEVVDLLARLIDRSLVVVAGARYRLLESVAAYGREQLGAEAVRTCQKHLAYYLSLAERAALELRGSQQRQWLSRLDVEAANLRAALDFAVQQGEVDTALRLVNALAWYWFLRGRLAEAVRSLAAALALAGDSRYRAETACWHVGIAMLAGQPVPASPSIADDRARWFFGFVRSDFGDPADSEALVAEALAAFQASGDRWGMAAALSTSAKLASIRGDFVGMREYGEQSLAIFAELGDCWGQLQATEWLGEVAEIHGEYELGRKLGRDALAMAEDLGLWPQAADRLSWLGRIETMTGDFVRARELHERALRLAREQGYLPGQAFAEMNLGCAARREGKFDEAERLLTGVLSKHPDPGPARVISLAELGFIAESRGDGRAARTFHQDGLAAARALRDRRAIATALEGLAGAEVVDGRVEEAARLLASADELRQSLGLPVADRFDADRISTAIAISGG
ncbi:BTAD domain-containing putative transcriptional regulator [Fodinicola feengrottensis]